MPCMSPDPTPEELRRSEVNYNYRKYGMSLTDNELVTTIINYCCEMGGLLDRNGLINDLGDNARIWYTSHKERDAKKLSLLTMEKEKEELEKKLLTLNAGINTLKREIL